jgi:hypothetical protein
MELKMSDKRSCSGTIEPDEEGCFLRLPEGWTIEPEDSDVLITRALENGSYLVTPVIDEHGRPNCRFIFPENDPA